MVILAMPTTTGMLIYTTTLELLAEYTHSSCDRNDSFYSHNPDHSTYYKTGDGFWRFEAQDGEVTTSEDVAASDDKTATSGNVKGKLFQRRPGK